VLIGGQLLEWFERIEPEACECAGAILNQQGLARGKVKMGSAVEIPISSVFLK
jgi:hypothetical protein